jgi:hypothetical protein
MTDTINTDRHTTDRGFCQRSDDLVFVGWPQEVERQVELIVSGESHTRLSARPNATDRFDDDGWERSSDEEPFRCWFLPQVARRRGLAPVALAPCGGTGQDSSCPPDGASTRIPFAVAASARRVS